MKLTIRGNKLEVTEAIRNYVEEKIGKLDKYFENAEDLSGNVLLRVQGKDQIVEVTIPDKSSAFSKYLSSFPIFSST